MGEGARVGLLAVVGRRLAMAFGHGGVRKTPWGDCGRRAGVGLSVMLLGIANVGMRPGAEPLGALGQPVGVLTVKRPRRGERIQRLADAVVRHQQGIDSGTNSQSGASAAGAAAVEIGAAAAGATAAVAHIVVVLVVVVVLLVRREQGRQLGRKQARAGGAGVWGDKLSSPVGWLGRWRRVVGEPMICRGWRVHGVVRVVRM